MKTTLTQKTHPMIGWTAGIYAHDADCKEDAVVIVLIMIKIYRP